MGRVHALWRLTISWLLCSVGTLRFHEEGTCAVRWIRTPDGMCMLVGAVSVAMGWALSWGFYILLEAFSCGALVCCPGLDGVDVRLVVHGVTDIPCPWSKRLDASRIVFRTCNGCV